MNNQPTNQQGFTYIEVLIYVSIISIMVTTIIPFAWNIIEGGTKSATQQEVSGNARLLSERIQYEVRNASTINSVSPTSISLANLTSSLNPTVITFSSPNITIKQGAGATVNLNSVDVTINNFSFINTSSTSGKTKNITFGFTANQAYTGSQTDFKSTIAISGSAEVRSH